MVILGREEEEEEKRKKEKKKNLVFYVQSTTAVISGREEEEEEEEEEEKQRTRTRTRRKKERKEELGILRPVNHCSYIRARRRRRRRRRLMDSCYRAQIFFAKNRRNDAECGITPLAHKYTRRHTHNLWSRESPSEVCEKNCLKRTVLSWGLNPECGRSRSLAGSESKALLSILNYVSEFSKLFACGSEGA